MKKTILIIAMMLMLSANTLSLGVAPARFELYEDDTQVKFKIFNNEKINTTIMLKIEGEQFIELDQNQILFTEDMADKIITAKIKQRNYNETQRAQILLVEQRKDKEQINLDLGLNIPIKLNVYVENASLDADFTVPRPQRNAKGPYTINIQNRGLKPANTQIALELMNQTIMQNITVAAKNNQEIILFFDEQTKKGMHDITLKINYDEKQIIQTKKVQSGTPQINIEKISINDLKDNLLDLNLQLQSNWPENMDNVKIMIKKEEESFESNIFNVKPNEKLTKQMIIDTKGDKEFELKILINNQEPQTHIIKITQTGQIYINGEIQQQNQQQNQLLTIMILILTLITIITYIIKNQILKKNNSM
ncbi:MAG: hypothetical protein ACLFN8_04295 [Candidatus Woesearchaeota archaeon]